MNATMTNVSKGLEILSRSGGALYIDATLRVETARTPETLDQNWLRAHGWTGQGCDWRYEN